MCEFYNFDLELLAPVTKKGVEKIIGIWDLDGHYKRFKTLGAKRYLYQTDDDKLHLTALDYVDILLPDNLEDQLSEKIDNPFYMVDGCYDPSSDTDVSALDRKSVV